MGIGVAQLAMPSGGVIAVKSLGRIVGRGPFVAVGGGSAPGGE